MVVADFEGNLTIALVLNRDDLYFFNLNTER